MKFKDLESFINYIHELPVRDTLINMGYISEEDFKGSKIRCLFHKGDNSPSLQITDNFFRCYACNSKGDIIKFIELIEGITFFESINKIATFVGADIENSNMSALNKRQRELQNEWDNYVKDFNEVIKHKNDLSLELIKQGRSFFPQVIGYDKAMNYIVLPFTSKTGVILGFTKRRVDIGNIENKNNPKWIHSSTKNSLINNCSNIFNLKNANKHIKETMVVYFVEGPRDVAAMQKANYLNTLSICGTSNFSQNIMNIINPVNSIIFVMDNDDAGNKSVKANCLVLGKIQPLILLETYVVDLPKGEDPASIDKNKLIECIENKVNCLKWLAINDIDSLKELYNVCESSIIRPHIIKLLMENMCLNYYQVEELLNRKVNNSINNNNNNNTYSHYDMLLATIGKHKDINVPVLNLTEEQCKKILKLRYREEH